MMKLIIDTVREAYSTDEVRNTLTVGELIAALSEYDEDTPVYTGHDERYTFGGITFERINEDYDDDEEEE